MSAWDLVRSPKVTNPSVVDPVLTIACPVPEASASKDVRSAASLESIEDEGILMCDKLVYLNE